MEIWRSHSWNSLSACGWNPHIRNSFSGGPKSERSELPLWTSPPSFGTCEVPVCTNAAASQRNSVLWIVAPPDGVCQEENQNSQLWIVFFWIHTEVLAIWKLAFEFTNALKHWMNSILTSNPNLNAWIFFQNKTTKENKRSNYLPGRPPKERANYESSFSSALYPHWQRPEAPLTPESL